MIPQPAVDDSEHNWLIGYADYCLSRYPVAKIRQIIEKKTMVKIAIESREIVIDMSDTPKNAQRKPEMTYIAGLNKLTVCQCDGSISIE